MNSRIRKFENKDKRAEGFSLVETIFCMGITAVVLMTVASVNMQLKRVTAKSASRNQIDILRQNLVGIIMSETAWKQTTGLNQNRMSCLNATAGGQQSPLCVYFPQWCAAGGSFGGGTGGRSCTNIGYNSGRSFALLDSYGRTAFDSTNPRNGFTTEGKPCNTYPLSGCSYSFDMKWWVTSGTAGGIAAVSLTLKEGRNYSTAINNANTLGLNADRYSSPIIYRAAQ